jgi:hypothetical protein
VYHQREIKTENEGKERGGGSTERNDGKMGEGVQTGNDGK